MIEDKSLFPEDVTDTEGIDVTVSSDKPTTPPGQKKRGVGYTRKVRTRSKAKRQMAKASRRRNRKKRR